MYNDGKIIIIITIESLMLCCRNLEENIYVKQWSLFFKNNRIFGRYWYPCNQKFLYARDKNCIWKINKQIQKLKAKTQRLVFVQ